MLKSTMIDGLGRPIAQLTEQDASHYIVVGQAYDAAGRVSSLVRHRLALRRR
jgi:hypothetical protein